MPVAKRTALATAPATTKTSATQQQEADPLELYTFHGLDLLLNKHGEAVGDCPFCGREGKFSVNATTGQWRCFVCGGGQQSGGGGPLDFLKMLWDISDKATTTKDYAALAKDRGLEYPETIAAWQFAKSVLTGNWLIPGWGNNYKGQTEFQQLYAYVQSVKGERMLLLPTPGRKHTLIGLNVYDPSCHEVLVCEGPWDALRLWESLRTVKSNDQGELQPTSALENSLLQGVSVLAAATCTTFPKVGTDKWFKNKVVTFLYDNDHPRVNAKTNTVSAPAGHAGMQRDTAKVAHVASDIRYLAWGPEGYDPELPSGYDLRDALRDSKVEGLNKILNSVEDVPLEWKAKEVVPAGTEISCKPCLSWQQLTTAWRKAMKWTSGLDHGLSAMLASIVSTASIGDQLWFKIIGPASCGKSTLCEAVSVNHKYVLAKSTIRGFHSGYSMSSNSREGSRSSEDHGLIAKLNGKTLVTKDGDTLLQSPNLGQILAEARDIYDGMSRTHYRNAMSKDYNGLRITWLLCGTSSLRAIDASELGERFLDCVIMDRIDEELEDDILWRTINQVDNQVGVEATGDAATLYTPEKLNAMELTGGYIDWLKDNASTMLPQIRFSDEAKRFCVDVGKFVAYMRARPSDKQQENAERELAARLVSQHGRAAKCLAFVLNRSEVDDMVLGRVRQLGLDTARGSSLRIVQRLRKFGGQGVETRAMSFWVSLGDAELRKLVKFMEEIGILEAKHTKVRKAWALSKMMTSLYDRVVGK